MSHHDPLEEMRRRIYRALRDTMRTFERELEEIESIMEEMLVEAREMEKLLDEREEEIRGGYTEPLSTLIDKGDKLLLIVEAPGAREETIEVIVTENKIQIEARLDEEKLRKALGSRAYTRRVSIMRGEYRIPYPVDLTRMKVEKRGSKVYIWIPKL